MMTPNRSTPLIGHPTPEQKHVLDYVRVVYKRRWVALPAFLLVFVFGAVNALRQTPIYQGIAQLLIESDSPNVAKIDQMFQNDGTGDDNFYQTQYRLLQSRSVAKRAIDAMKLWDVARLGNGPEPKEAISITNILWSGLNGAISLAKKPFQTAPPSFAKAGPGSAAADAAVAAANAADVAQETSGQSSRIDEFLSSVAIVPVRYSRIVEVRYDSTDPKFAADAANAVAKAYIQQNMEYKFSTTKEAADWLSDRLAEQRQALEKSEAALQAYKERNGTVSVADTASNIVVQRLTDLNGALTKAKTERINKEAQYNQLQAAEAAGTLDTFPTVIANDYIQKLRTDLADLQRQQAALAQRYGERHAEMIKINGAIQSADAKLKNELSKVVESVRNEYQASLSEERSLQGALDSQKTEALSQNRKGIEYGVLQREAESNKQIYESLMQRTKETGISSEMRASNVRIVDPAEVPRTPISPNLQHDLLVSFSLSFALAVGLAFGLEQLDSRIRTPQEMKAQLGLPFLGMVPTANKKDGLPNPLLNNGVPPNFVEAFKTVRTNVLFSTAKEGLRSLVVTSAGPGEGKSIVAANLAIALAQAGQRVLLIDADMRRPRVHEIFETSQEPGLSNVLTGNAKVAEALRRSSIGGLWLMSSGHIPPNPSELIGSPKYHDVIASLEDHFDWAIIDTPPVLAVADSTIAANLATGVVFVVGGDKTNRNAARAAVDQLDASGAHITGGVLNNVELDKHPHYYAAYYRKEYAKYYTGSAS